MVISDTNKILEQAQTCTDNEHNKEIVLKYVKTMRRNGLKIPSIKHRLAALIFFFKYVDIDVDKLTPCDIDNFLDSLAAHTYTHKNRDEKHHLAPYTQLMYKKELKTFLKDSGRADIADLIPTKRTESRKMPEDMLDKVEIEKLIDTATNARDRAFISVLYESGARVGEHLNCMIKHAVFDDNGVVLTFPDGKTGARRIRLVFSAPYLRQWLDVHPHKHNRDSALWARLDDAGTPLGYEGIRMMLKRTGKKAGIQKPVNPHHFRHTRATHLAEHLTEQQMKAYLGWTAGSNMAAVYVHLSGKDMDNSILKMNGIKIDETIADTLKVGKCPRCHQINQDKSSYCFMCGMPLSQTTIEQTEIDKGEFAIKMMMAFNDPAIQQMINDKYGLLK